MSTVGTCINDTGELLLVYGTKTADTPQDRDNALFRLPAGRRTPPGWDCDGIYVPSDRVAGQAVFPDKHGPVAVKYGVQVVDFSFTIRLDDDRYDLPVNQGVFTPAEVCTGLSRLACLNWNIPSLAHDDLDGFPEVSGHLPAHG